MAQTNGRKLDGKAVQSIMKQRILVPSTLVGKKVQFTVVGSRETGKAGNIMDVTNKAGEPVMSVVDAGVILQKVVYNVQASSVISQRNPRNIAWLKEGIAAERAGNAELAHEKFTQFLNATQMSFNILLPSGIVDRIQHGTEIAGKVQLIETDNGQTLTLDDKTISIVEPEVLVAGAIDLSSYFAGEESTNEPSTEPAITAGDVLADVE
jgi:hypothetical protein